MYRTMLARAACRVSSKSVLANTADPGRFQKSSNTAYTANRQAFHDRPMIDGRLYYSCPTNVSIQTSVRVGLCGLSSLFSSEPLHQPLSGCGGWLFRHGGPLGRLLSLEPGFTNFITRLGTGDPCGFALLWQFGWWRR